MRVTDEVWKSWRPRETLTKAATDSGKDWRRFEDLQRMRILLWVAMTNSRVVRGSDELWSTPESDQNMISSTLTMTTWLVDGGDVGFEDADGGGCW